MTQTDLVTLVSSVLTAMLLKKLELPKEDEFKRWLDDAEEWAAQSGLTEDDMPAIISEVRMMRSAYKPGFDDSSTDGSDSREVLLLQGRDDRRYDGLHR